MGFFEEASDFTIDGGTMNDIAGDHVTNNNTTNNNRTNCNNSSKSSVKDSFNNFSRKYVEGGNTTNNNNGGGSFYQATGVQNVHATPPVQHAGQERAKGAIATRPSGRAVGAARLAARGGARPRHAIDQRPHNPTYSLSPTSPLREARPEYATAPSKLKSNNPYLNASSRGYTEQPRAAQRPSLFPTQSTPNFDSDDDWYDELTGASEGDHEDVKDQTQSFRERPLHDQRSRRDPFAVGSRRNR